MFLTAEVFVLLFAELLVLMKVGLESLPGMCKDASEGEAVLAVALARLHVVC